MKVLATFAYFPAIGWFFPMFFGTKCSLCQYHAKQGLAAFVFSAFCTAFTWFFNHSVPTFASFVETLLYSTCIIMYVFFLGWGIICAIQEIEKPLPLIGEKAANLPL